MNAPASHLRILSYNIHKGFGLGNRRFVLDRIKTAIELVQADLVCLQEVVGENALHAEQQNNWPKNSQFEFIADKIWPHFAYGKNAAYHAGHHGNAILSRFPIRAWHNFDLATNFFEARGALHVEIDHLESRQILHCISLHLNILPQGQKRQLKELTKYIAMEVPSDAALILAGDFNDWTQHASLGLKRDLGLSEIHHSLKGRYARTFPTPLPLLTLDRIYARGVKALKAHTLSGDPWQALSDHAALYAEVQFSSSVASG